MLSTVRLLRHSDGGRRDMARRPFSRSSFTLLIALWVAQLAAVNAYPYGAPDDACASLLPQHGSGPRSSSAPYSITTSGNSYAAGQQITGE